MISNKYSIKNNLNILIINMKIKYEQYKIDNKYYIDLLLFK